MDPSAPVLMFVTDAERHGVELTLRTAERVCRSAAPGRVIVQLRDRGLEDGARLGLGRGLRDLTRDAGQWFSVNQRVDLACLLDADAIHLPREGPSPRRVIALLQERGRRLFVSSAGHDPESAPGHVDGWVLSPVVEARKGRPALGFEVLAAAVASHPELLVFALGGVGPESAQRCREVGARVAVVEAAYRAADELVEALGIAKGAPLSGRG